MSSEKLVAKIVLPQGIEAEANGLRVTVRGKNEETRLFKAKGISFKAQENSIVVEASPATRRMNAVLRTMSSHVRNMIQGAQHDYCYRMAIVFSHFPMNVQAKGERVEIYNFLGEKQARIAKVIGKTKVEAKGKEVLVSGANKEHVGQTAANIETATKVRKKDKRVYQDGIFIVEKAK